MLHFGILVIIASTAIQWFGSGISTEAYDAYGFGGAFGGRMPMAGGMAAAGMPYPRGVMPGHPGALPFGYPFPNYRSAYPVVQAPISPVIPGLPTKDNDNSNTNVNINSSSFRRSLSSAGKEQSNVNTNSNTNVIS